jgi:hypothetical protein
MTPSPSASTARSSAATSAPAPLSTSAATSAPAPLSTPVTNSRSPSTAIPTVAEREQALHDRVDPQNVSALVLVPAGFEAAVYDHAGSISFWANPTASANWTRIGSSEYPYNPQAASDARPRVLATRLSHMAHATFIVRGYFTGDASGNAVAFTTGDHGCGAVKAEPSGRIGPSGAPVGSDMVGLSYDFQFANGELVTVDCPTNRPQYQYGRYPIKKYWLWNGHDFTQQ